MAKCFKTNHRSRITSAPLISDRQDQWEDKKLLDFYMSLCDNRSCKICVNGMDLHTLIGSLRTFDISKMHCLLSEGAIQVANCKLLYVGHCCEIFITLLPQRILVKTVKKSDSKGHS